MPRVHMMVWQGLNGINIDCRWAWPGGLPIRIQLGYRRSSCMQTTVVAGGARMRPLLRRFGSMCPTPPCSATARVWATAAALRSAGASAMHRTPLSPDINRCSPSAAADIMGHIMCPRNSPSIPRSRGAQYCLLLSIWKMARCERSMCKF